MLIIAVSFFGSNPVFGTAGINQTINFQGKLVNSSGLNVANGNYDIIFKLYDDPTAGSELWTETWNSGTTQVSVTDGVFRVALGTHATMSSLDFNQDAIYLSVKVGADAAMTPRIRFTSVPYAFVAKTVVDDALDFAQFQDTLDLDTALIVNQTTNTWTQNFTGDTTSGLTYNANSLTSGTALTVGSSASAFTGSLGSFALTGNNAANTGTVLKASSTGASNTGTVAMFTNLGAGYSLRVNDETGDADTTPFVIDASGNVGIGTTGPGAKLDVVGDFKASTTGYFGSTLTAEGDAVIGKNEAVNHQLKLFTGASNDSEIWFYPYSDYGFKLGNYGTTGAKYFKLKNNNGDALLTFGPNNTTDAVLLGNLAVQGTGNSSIAGNVGIGTTSPGARLDIVGSQNFTAFSAPGALTAGTPSAGGSCTAGTHSYKVTFTSVGAGETTAGTVSSVITCVLTTGQTVPLSAIPTGPAGTTGRKVYRTVAGDTGSYLLLTTIADNTTTTYSDTAADASLGAVAPVSNTTAVANLQTGGTTRMVIDSTGNVGIGTTGPSGLLTLNQGADDGEIFNLKSSDIAHGVTNRTQTDTYMFISKSSATAGGTKLESIVEDGNALPAWEFNAGTSGDTTKTTAGRANFEFNGYRSAAPGGAGQDADTNMLSVRANSLTKWLVDREGTIHTIVGSDADVNLLTVQVTGTPTFSWDESQDQFDLSKGVNIAGNVGIGTTGPGQKLTVVGGRMIAAAASENFAVGAQYVSTAGAFWMGATNAANADGVFSNGAGTPLVTMQYGGNVGIGTTGPGNKLEVSGGGLRVLGSMAGAPSGTGAEVEWDGTAANFQSYNRGTPGWTPAALRGSYASLYSEGTEVLRATTGNVGIGTTGPRSKLDVNGDVYLGVTGTADGIIRTDDSFWINIDNNNDNTDRLFGVQTNNTTELFRIAESGLTTIAQNLVVSGTGNTTIAGNVGIGTTGPARTLDVAGVIGVTDSTVLRGTILTNSVTAGEEDALVVAAASDDIIFRNSLTAGTSEAMRILSTGNVGIGTTSPGAPLEVFKTGISGDLIQKWNYNSGPAYDLKLKEVIGAANVSWVFDQTNNDASFPNVLAFNKGNVGIGYEDPGTAKLAISGNVGIGTTAPSSMLSVGASSQFQVNSSGDIIKLKNLTYAWPSAHVTTSFLKNDGSGNLTWSTDITATALKWNALTAPDGNLALSMTAYTTAFTWNAATGANNLFTLADTTSNTGTGYLLNLATATSSTLKPFRVSAAGTEALMVNASGNIGIGTTAPLAKLEIGSGNIAGANVGYSTGAPTIVSRFDGPKPDETDFTGNPNGNLGQAATVTGGVIFRPGKFGKGVQIAEATTNKVPNPSLEVDTAGWTVGGTGSSIARVTTDSIYGSASMQAVMNGAGSTHLIYANPSIGNGVTHTVSFYAKSVSGNTSLHSEFWGSVTYTDVTLTTSWQKFTYTGVSSGVDNLYFWLGGVGTFLLDGVQVEQKSYATPYADGSLGNGHSWSGTAHASTSSRTVADLSYTLPPGMGSQGTVMFWVKAPYISTANTNPQRMFYSLAGGGVNDLAIWRSDSLMYFEAGAPEPSTSYSWATESWHHVVMTWTVGGNVVGYIDGVQVGSASLTTAFTPPSPFYIGGQGGATNHSNDMYDDFAIFPTALSAQEIYSIYKSNAPIQTEDKSSVLTASEILPVTSGGVSKLILAGSVAGNVGIGSTSPAAKLTINGTTEQLRLSYDASNYQAFTVGSTGDLFIAQDGGAATLALTNGSVGIGTTGPTEKLEVSGGAIRVSDQTSAGRQLILGSDGTNALNFYNNAGAGTANALSQAGDKVLSFTNGTIETGNLVIGPWSASAYGMRMTNTGKVGFGYADPGTAQVAINGNVGIGTTGPARTLDVAGVIGVTDSTVLRGTILTNSVTASEEDALVVAAASDDIIFRNSLTAGTSEAMRILSTGNVGIGTTGPGAKFHVKSVGEIARLETTTARGSGANYLQYNDPTGVKGYVGYTGADDDFEIYNTMNADIVLSTNASPVMTLKTGGNVGIGTTGPTQKLDVAGSINLTGGIAGGTTYSGSGNITSSAGVLTISGTGNSSIAGNVGIGTTGPGYKLEVAGGGATALGITGTGYVVSTFRSTTADSGTRLYIGNDTAAAQGELNTWGSTYTTNAYQVANGTELVANGAGGLTLAAANGSGVIKFVAGGLTEKVRIDTTGNVGIGTTAPGQKLDVNGNVLLSGGSQDYLFNTADLAGELAVQSQSAGTSSNLEFYTKDGDGTDANRLILNGLGTPSSQTNLEQLLIGYEPVGPGFVIRSLASGTGTRRPIALEADGTNTYDQLYLATTGNVGIGTTGPGSLLSVGPAAAADVTIRGTTGGIGGRILLAGPNGASTYFVVRDNPGLGDLEFINSAYSAVNVTLPNAGGLIVNRGNVGIGSTSPAAKLTINGTTEQLRLSYDASNYQAFTVGSTGDLFIAQDGGAATLALTNGSVGIGTTGPQVKLDIEASTGPSLRLGTNSGESGDTIGKIEFYQNNYNPTYPRATIRARRSIGGASDGQLIFSTALHGADVTDKMLIDQEGNVGIGTTAPSSILTLGNANPDITVDTVDSADTKALRLSGGGTISDNRGATLQLFGNEKATNGGSVYLTAGNVTAGDIFLQTAALDRVTIKNNGNVGIGTTGPGAKLDVVSNVAIGLQLKANTADGSSTAFNVLDSNAAALFSIGTDGLARFYDNGTERVRIQSDGNVGIGTTAPEQKLTIAGGDAYIYDTSDLGSELFSNAGATGQTDWVDGNSDGMADDWTAEGYGTGSIVTGNGFTGNAQRNTVDAGLYARLAQSETFVSGGLYKVVFKYRSSMSGNISTNASGGGVAVGDFAINTGNATTATYYFTANGSSIHLRWQIGPGTNGVDYLEIDEVSVKEVVGGDLIARGILTGGGTNGIKILANGNVGIGTTGPTAKLAIKASAASGEQLYLIQSNDDRGWKLKAKTDGHLYIQSSYSGTDTDRLFVDYINGNVGIGTTGPGFKLDVSGVTRINPTETTNPYGVLIAGSVDRSAGGTAGAVSALKITTALTPENEVVSGRSIYGLYANLGTMTGISAAGNNTFADVAITPATVSLPGGASLTNHMGIYIDSAVAGATNNYAIYAAGTSDKSYFGGNVGIGTTGPGYKLDVAGDLRSTTGAYFATTSGNVGIGTTAPGDKLTVSGNVRLTGATARNINFYNDTDVNLNAQIQYDQLTANSGQFFFGTNNAGSFGTRMTITKEGNVGIGSTSPAAKLTINGTTEQLRLSYDASNYQAFTVGSTGDLFIAQDGGAATLALTNGSVGIGTTGPARLLHLSSAGPQIGFSETGVTANNTLWDMLVDQEHFAARILDDADTVATTWLQVERTGQTVDSVTIPNGNVGIGTTGPSQKLDVAGHIALTGGTINDIITKTSDGSDNSVIEISPAGAVGSTRGAYIQLRGNEYANNIGMLALAAGNVGSTGTEGFITFDTAGATKMVIDRSGNVGIGTTGPLYTLDVNGGEIRNTIGVDSVGEKGGILFSFAGATVTRPLAGIYSYESNSAGAKEGALYFKTKTNQSSESFADLTTKMVINNNGNVGIGTTGPTSLLHVVGSQPSTGVAAIAALTVLGGTGGNGSNSVGYAGGLISLTGGTGGNGQGGVSSNNGGTGGAINITAGTGGQNLGGASGLNPSGDGGVLTLTGGAGGDANSGGSWSAGNGGAVNILGGNAGSQDTYNKNGGSVYIVGGTKTVSGADGNVLLGITSGGTARGNVGIGSTSPAAKLTINGTTEQLRLSYDASNYQAFTVGSTGDLFIAQDGGAATLALTNGSVGIGTVSPDTKLFVQTDPASTNSILDVATLARSTTGTAVAGLGSRLRFVLEDGGANMIDTGGISSYWVDPAIGVRSANTQITSSLGNSPVTVATFTSAGNVGIGTTGPQGNLHISSSSSVDDLIINQVATTNLMNNPSIETNTTGQNYCQNASCSRSNEQSYMGAYSLKAVSSAAGGVIIGQTTGEYINVSASTQYSASYWVYSATADRSASIYLIEFTSGGVYVTERGVGSSVTVPANTWTRVPATFTTGGTTGQVSIRTNWSAGAVSQTVYFDAFQLEQKSSTTPYADGSLGPGYSWSGTAHDSSSSRTAGAIFGYQTLNMAGGIGSAARSTTPALRIEQDGTGDIAQFWQANNQYVTIKNTGNVGIGSTSPAAKLTINGTTEQLRLSYDASNYQAFTVGSTGDLFIAQDGGAATLALTNGSVGIGTTAPAHKLEVAGDVVIRSDTLYRFEQRNAADALLLAMSANPANGNFTLTTNANPSAFSIEDIGARASFAGALTVSGTGNSSIAGNVGIGTTGPVAPFHVKKGAAGGTTSMVTPVAYFENNADAYIEVISPVGSVSAVYLGDSTHNSAGGITYKHSTGLLSFRTSGDSTKDMVLNSTGNVGIGTTGPGAKLDVRDGNLILTDVDVAHAMTVVTPTNAFGSLVPQDATGGGLGVVGTTDADVVGLRLSGLLGVASPTSQAILLQGAKTNGANSITDLAAGELLLSVYNNNTSKVTILGSGNVGIGTTSPTNILSLGNAAARKFWIENSATDVVGRALTVAAGGTIAGTSVSDVVGGNLILQAGLGTGTGASTISFQTGTTLTTGTTLQTMSTKMTILGDGSVGIGTVAPSGVLDLGSATGGRGIAWSGSSSANYANIWTTYGASDMVLATGMKGDTTVDQYLSSASASQGRAAIRINAYTGTGGSLHFFTDADAAVTLDTAVVPTERMTIDYLGRVAIADISPDFRFEVVEADNTLFAPPVSFNRTASSGDYLGQLQLGTSGGGDLFFSTNSAGLSAITTWATWDLTDNRWEAPSTTTVGANQIIFGTSGAAGGIAFKTQTAAAVTAGDAITFNNTLMLTDEGLVGIGTVAPLSQLGVLGNASIGATYGAIAAPTSGLIIEGNVGIGTTGPVGKLQVVEATAGTTLTADILQSDNTNTASNTRFGVRTGGASGGDPVVNLGIVGVGSWHWGIDNSDSDKLLLNWDTSSTLSATADSGTEVLAITTTGNVGIGTTGPSVALDVIGDIEYTGTITDVSDIRLKENFEPIVNPLGIINGLQGLKFNMIGFNVREVGLIAQDVQKVLPEAVRIVDPGNGYLGVSYPSLIPVLIEGIKEQQVQIEDIAGIQSGIDWGSITSRVELLEDKVATHTDQIASIEARMDTIALLSGGPVELGNLSELSAIISIESDGGGMSTLTIDADMMVLGRIVAEEINATKNISAGTVIIDGASSAINSLSGLLRLQNSLTAGDIEMFAGQIIMTNAGDIRAKGNVTSRQLVIDVSEVAGVATSSGELVASGSATLQNKSVGDGTIVSGETFVRIENTLTKPNSKIFITATSETGGQTLIVSLKELGAFTVKVTTEALTDITFDYWIVGVSE